MERCVIPTDCWIFLRVIFFKAFFFLPLPLPSKSLQVGWSRLSCQLFLFSLSLDYGESHISQPLLDYVPPIYVVRILKDIDHSTLSNNLLNFWRAPNEHVSENMFFFPNTMDNFPEKPFFQHFSRCWHIYRCSTLPRKAFKNVHFPTIREV